MMSNNIRIMTKTMEVMIRLRGIMKYHTQISTRLIEMMKYHMYRMIRARGIMICLIMIETYLMVTKYNLKIKTQAEKGIEKQ